MCKLKYLVSIIGIFLTINSAWGSNTDSTKRYFKIGVKESHMVDEEDGYDYYQVIYTMPRSEKLFQVKEFYKNGGRKFEGVWEAIAADNGYNGDGFLQGQTESYFPNGKKQSQIKYLNGQKVGLAYQYYPSGQLYTVERNELNVNGAYLFDCYDKTGNQICHKGNGKWVMYNRDFTNITFSGRIKGGLLHGAWEGMEVINSDTIKYTLKYDNAMFISGSSTDKEGRNYVFKEEEEYPRFKDGNLDGFVRLLKSKLILPHKTDGTLADTAKIWISFVVGRDGHYTEINVYNTKDEQVISAYKDIITNCPEWVPRKHHGIPLSTRFTLLISKTAGADQQEKKYLFNQELIDVIN